MEDLFARGADAFLTAALDERLRAFNVFLRASMDAKEPILNVVFGYNLNLLGKFSTVHDFTSEARGRWARTLGLGDIRVDLVSASLIVRGSC